MMYQDIFHIISCLHDHRKISPPNALFFANMYHSCLFPFSWFQFFFLFSFWVSFLLISFLSWSLSFLYLFYYTYLLSDSRCYPFLNNSYTPLYEFSYIVLNVC